MTEKAPPPDESGEFQARPGRKAARAAQQARVAAAPTDTPNPRAKKNPPRKAGAKAKEPAGTGPKVVGIPKQEFGTRTSRRILCTRCGKTDHVPFVPRNKDNVLCRSCAEEVVNVYEEGVRLPRQMRPAQCALCQVHFSINEKIPIDAEVLCLDCLKGNEIWQGSLAQPPEDRGRVESEKRASGIRLRRRKK